MGIRVAPLFKLDFENVFNPAKIVQARHQILLLDLVHLPFSFYNQVTRFIWKLVLLGFYAPGVSVLRAPPPPAGSE